MVRLPVSGIEIELLASTGADDLLLAEATELGIRLALTIAGRLARGTHGEAMDWAQASVTDMDALFLLLRASHFGDLIRAEAVCPGEGCGKRMDVTFGVVEYLDHHRPVRPRGVQDSVDAGWYRLTGADIEFRLPAVSDLKAVRHDGRASESLADLCLRPPGMRGAARRRAQLAMAAMAPSLCQDLESSCPECARGLEVRFDPQVYVLRELQGGALDIHQDIHVLAMTYHWSEAQILALPRQRRRLYAEMAREEAGLA